MGVRAKAAVSSTEHKRAEELAKLRTLVRKHAGKMKTIKEQQQQQANRHAQEMKKTKEQHQRKLQEQAANQQATAAQHVSEVAQWQMRLRSVEELLTASTVATVSVEEQVPGLGEDALERLEEAVRVERKAQAQRAREEAKAEAREEGMAEARAEARQEARTYMLCSVCMDAPKNCTLNCGICKTVHPHTHTHTHT